MKARPTSIILTLLLTIFLSCDTTAALTGPSFTASQSVPPDSVIESDSSGEISSEPSDPLDMSDQNTSESGQDEMEQDQPEVTEAENDKPDQAEKKQIQESSPEPEKEPALKDTPEKEEEPVTYEADIVKGDDGCLYYIDPMTGEIRTSAGFIIFNDNRYYIQDGGKIVTNKSFKVGDRKYHVNAKGVIITGLHRWNDHYYFSGNKGVLRTKASFVRVNGRLYYVRQGGVIAENRSISANGHKYHAGKKGIIRTGVHKWKDRYYYSSLKSGKIRTASGFVRYNGNLYYIRSGGTISAKRTFSIGGKTYRSRANGKIATGVYRWGNKYYYSDPKTGEWIRTNVFKKWENQLYYIQEDGTLAANKVFAVHNQTYYSDKNCRAKRLSVKNPTNNQVLAVAQKQVGIMTGEKYWRWYFGTRFIDTDRTPWCGTFVGWCYDQAGKYWQISSAGNVAYVPCYTWFANRNDCWISKTAARGGDIAVFGRDRHVGIVERVYKGYLITIEGNSGPTAANGCGLPGAVTRKVYNIHDSDIKGIIHP